MAASADEVIAKIKGAFPAKRPPGLALIEPEWSRFPGDEYEDVENTFRDLDDWTAIDVSVLVRSEHMEIRAFMSDAALRFYIPAYMVADLQGKMTFTDPSFSLIIGFDDQASERRHELATQLHAKWGMAPPKKFTFGDLARRRWTQLDSIQVEAVVAYLEWIIERDGPLVAEDVAEALATYWHPRAGR